MADTEERPAGVELHSIDSNTTDHHSTEGGRSRPEHKEDGDNKTHKQHHDDDDDDDDDDASLHSSVSDTTLSPPMPNPEEPEASSTAAAAIPPELRDATELSTIRSSGSTRSNSFSSISSGSVRMVTRRSTAASARTSSTVEPTGPFRKVKKFWFSHVVVSVAQKQNRDHFALERTYLAFIRTSLAFAMLGVLIAQLFSLNHAVVHDANFGFYKVGKPLSCICHGFAILVASSGAYRFWRQQNALARGKIHAGGREMLFVSAIAALVIIPLFVVVIIISVRRDSDI